MNEQILRKIINQTDVYCDSLGLADQIAYNTIWEAKFAQFIVQECISTIDSTPFVYDDYRNQIEEGMRDACVNSLKRHFEVE
jgi:hypothetical protein